jgi:glutamyl-tRNA synthetase
VVDDHDMGVTHVIRGVDHLTNAARQIQIYQALGWPVPEMAHIPLIHGPTAPSCRSATARSASRPIAPWATCRAALRNYLARLGWSHGDQEVFSTEELIELFSLEHVGRSPARFDFAKLESVNGISSAHARSESARGLHRLPAPCRRRQGLLARLDEAEGQMLKALPALKTRAKTLVELQAAAGFIFAERPLDLDERPQGRSSDEAAHAAQLLPELAGNAGVDGRGARGHGQGLCRAPGR